jgi:SAM-dependent methyltransferase
VSATGVHPSSCYRATDGAAYERFLGRWTQRLAPVFCDFAKLPPAGAALEVGCGTGSLALAMAAMRGQPVSAIDVAEPYIAYARERPGAAHVAFEQGDACKLRFADGSFAGALAQLVLNFVPDALTAVREMKRVTERRGVVAGAIWDFRGGLVYQRIFWDSAAAIDPAAGAARDKLFSHPLAQASGLLDLWQRADLAEIELGSLTIRMDYSDFEDYWDPLLAGQGPVGVYVQGLDPELRKRVKAQVMKAYLSGAPDGPRSLTATAWAVRGIVA